MTTYEIRTDLGDFRFRDTHDEITQMGSDPMEVFGKRLARRLGGRTYRTSKPDAVCGFPMTFNYGRSDDTGGMWVDGTTQIYSIEAV